MSLAPHHDEEDAFVSVLPTPKALDHGPQAATPAELAASGADPFAGSHAPEVLFISAMLDSGFYTPEAWEVTDEMVSGHKPVHAFCQRYQAQANRAPSPQLVVKRFPGFPYMSGVSTQWAANELIRDHTSRTLRRQMSKAAGHLGEDSVDDAVLVLREALDTTRVGALPYVSIDNYDLLPTDGEGAGVPEGTQRLLLGEHRPGHVWTTAAYSNVGKSWELANHAVAALESGWDCTVFSLEMPGGEWLDRIHRIALRDWADPWYLMTEETRERSIREWQERTQPGMLKIYDKPVSPLVLRGLVGEGTKVIVDYLGLMRGSDGSRASSDWRVVAGITSELKEVALDRNVPIHGGNQLNRSGSGTSLQSLSGGDAVGNDSDVVMIMAEHTQASRQMLLPKNRHGAKGQSWYQAFDPEHGQFGDISKQMAARLELEDDDD